MTMLLNSAVNFAQNAPSDEPDGQQELATSTRSLRRTIGFLGLALPVLLAFGKWMLESPGIEPSISDYYYTVMGSVFVGSLSAIGITLYSYKGYRKSTSTALGSVDDIAGTIAGIAAIGVALFPTPHSEDAIAQAIGQVHFTCATIFFLTLAFFALKLFRKTDPSKPMTAQKKLRNGIYTVCGCLILLCVTLIAIYSSYWRNTVLSALDPVFWLEAIAVWAFGISWLVKGEVLFADAVDA
jgi:hypothetical protein